MIIKEDVILYFSGTGNSLQIAKDIHNNLAHFNLCKITSIEKEEEIEVKSKSLGIVFPVYYAGLPLIVDRIIKKLNISEDTYVFGIVSHGGAPARVLSKLKRALEEKGGTLNSGFLIKMPANNVLAYNMKDMDRYNSIFEKEKKRIEEILPVIAERKNHPYDVSRLVIDIIIDKAFIKLTDKIVREFPTRDRHFWVKDSCNGCRLCERVCPVKNIEFSSSKPMWKHNCEQCTACIQYCPKEAIQWGNKTLKRKRYRNPNVKII